MAPINPQLAQSIQEDKDGFPTDFCSPSLKDSPEYALRYCQAVDNDYRHGRGANIFRGRSDNYETMRAYARGNQSIEKYKPILGIKQKTKSTANAVNYKVLSWEVLAIAPKFVNLLVGKLIAQNNDVGVMAVDKRAQDDKRKKRVNLQEYIVNKQFLDGVTKSTGIQFEGPEHDDSIPPPQNLQEVNIYQDMFYKEKYCLILQDMLKLLNEQDNYVEILKNIAEDLVEIGLGATKTYRVGRRIRRRRCIPERMVASATTSDNFENCKYIGEYWDLTIGELKEIAGMTFTEAEYKDIAEKATGNSFSTFNVKDYYERNFCYPWDRTKITVLDITWWSPNEAIYTQDVNNFGNVQVNEKSYEWWAALRGKGVTEQSFNQQNKSQVIIQPLNDQYGAMWILGTKYVFGQGKTKDMLKNESDMGKTVGPYCMYSLKKDCLIRQLIPVFDMIQINWLQYQHHTAKSRPSGPAIEFSALQDISIEGAGGRKMKPKEVLELYFDTGILLWRRRDAAGNMSNFKPIEELVNGINPAAKEHLLSVIQLIDLVRGIIGLNEVTDASTPNSEMGKSVANLAVGGTQDAIKYIFHGFDSINVGTQLRTTMHISQMAATGMAPDYTEAIGLDNMAFMGLMSDLTVHEFGCYLIKQPTQEMRAVLDGYCQAGIVNGTLYEEEAFEIKMEPNIYRAIRLLKVYRQQKLDQKQAEVAAQQQGEMQKNIGSAQATAQAAQQTMQMETDAKVQQAWQEAQARVWESKATLADKAFLLNLEAKLKMNLALTEAEQDRLTAMSTAQIAGEYALQAAKLKPKPQPSKK